MLSMLLFIQALQVKHVFTTVHQEPKASQSQYIVAHEIACPICEYLVHQQHKFTPLYSEFSLKPAETVRNIHPLENQIRPAAPDRALQSNKSPPRFA